MIADSSSSVPFHSKNLARQACALASGGEIWQSDGPQFSLFLVLPSIMSMTWSYDLQAIALTLSLFVSHAIGLREIFPRSTGSRPFRYASTGCACAMAQFVTGVSISPRPLCLIAGALVVWLIFGADKPWSISHLGPAKLETRPDRWLLFFLGSCRKPVHPRGTRAHGAMVGGAKTDCSSRHRQTVASMVLAVASGCDDLLWRGSFACG